MMFKIAAFFAVLGMMAMLSAFPVSMYVNGDQIWTAQGQIAGNRCMMTGFVLVFISVILGFVDWILDD